MSAVPTDNLIRWLARTAAAEHERAPEFGVLASIADDLLRAVPCAENAQDRRNAIIGALLQVHAYTVKRERTSAQAAANAAIEGFQTTLRLAVDAVCKRKVSADFSLIVPDEPT